MQCMEEEQDDRTSKHAGSIHGAVDIGQLGELDHTNTEPVTCPVAFMQRLS